MEHLSIALRALFSRQKGDAILRAAGFLKRDANNNIVHLDSDITESQITKLLLDEEANNYSIDQLSMTGQLVLSKWMMPDPNCLPMQFHQKDSVFNLLLHFASSALRTMDGDPVCRYDALLRWHTLTTQLGEDIFTTAYLASCNLATGYKRKLFDWPAFLNHDCKEVNAIFERPIADLHMHLKGSSYNFDISWIFLMNHIDEMRAAFDEVSEHRKDTEWDNDLFEKVKRAAAIRYYLACACGCINAGFSKSLLEDIIGHSKVLKYLRECETEIEKNGEDEKLRDNVELILKNLSKFDFQSIIDEGLKNSKRQAAESSIDDRFVIDYIPVEHYEKEPVTNLVMASERKLMYDVFYRILANTEGDDEDLASLFYAYLTYKDEFRHTILQLNERVGFANFAKYEELKTAFLREDGHPLLYKAAIDGFLKDGKDRYIEARVVPKDTPEEIEKSVREILQSLDADNQGRCSIILHFIKKRDNAKDDSRIRNNELREEVKKKAFAIYGFRQLDMKDDNIVGKVVGIDAANSEIYARPEVFAQAFRFLRSHELFSTEKGRPNDLSVTYHVGEDFLDLADGLRAIEEAMIFLNMRAGDRLGHALALGTDVRSYYSKRYDTICESKQVILDNLAWLYHKCLRLMGMCPLSSYLETMFHKYFREVYLNKGAYGGSKADDLFTAEDERAEYDDIRTYYLSWLLRGDSPTFGNDLTEEYKRSLKTTEEKQWAEACINHHKGAEMARHNANARELYDMYHSTEVKRRDNAVDSFTVMPMYREEYYQLLAKIQEDLLSKIERKHIAIECNPSSNYKIGDFERYDQHPIVKFYNSGLDIPYPKHNIAVSINTDDQGVFSTSLEREYSLMALAMEKNTMPEHYNSSRTIVEWLDSIREMSIEQRFDKN